MAHNDQDHSSLNLPQETLGNSRVEATADIQEMQMDEPQQPSSEPPQYSEVVAGPSSTFPPVASSHTEQGPADEMPPLIALSDDEESQSPQADASTSRAPNTRRARVEDEEDEDEQRESNRQRITSPGAGSDADADHHYHPDIHTHEQEREQQQQQQQQPEGAPPTFHHMAFTLDWFPISLNPAPGARPAGANAGLPPLQTAFGNFGFDLAPHIHDVPINPTGAAPAQQQQQDHPNAQPQPHPDAPPAAQNGASPAFFDLMRHLRDTIGGIQFGPDGTPANLPPGVHIHTGPPIFPPFGPMMGGMDFQEPDDPVRAMKLLKGLEEVSPGLLKRMERVAQEDQEMPVCAVCFDSLLEPAVEDEAQSSPEQPADSDSVPMDVDTESTASNDPAISSTASTSGSTVTSSSTSTETTTNTPTTPAVDTSLDHKVFVLPCAHAFHGSCLRPWFTRPHRTTCPTCRFDVDPESLTYVAPPPGAQMDRIRQLFARAQRARAAANANGGGNANAAPAPAAAGTNTNADAAPPLPFPLDLPQLPQLVDPRLLDPDDEITIIPIERVPAGSNAPLGAAAGNAPPPAANAQPTGNAQPNANATGAGGFPAGMPPIGIILDFSLVFPPGARPVPPPAAQAPTGAQPAEQVPQPAGPQAQDQPAGSQPQPGAGGQGGQNALPPASQRILDRVVNMRGQNGVTPASQRIIEQVVRGILSALAGPLPPPPAPPVPSTPVNPATGASTNDAPPAPAERANSPPAASAASARAVSEPPMGSPPPPPPPFMSFGGGGPLPAFGASIPVNALGPLPSFNEFVQLVQGGDNANATGQAGGRTGVPEPPPPQEQVPRQGEAQPPNPNEGEQGQGQAPPGYSDFLHNIQHMVSNTMHRILTRPGAPQQDAHAPAPPQGTAPIPPHPSTAQQARPPQPPGPIPLHVPPPLAVPLPHAHHHHHHHHHPQRPAGPKREWTVPPPPGPTLRARVERKERELGLRCWDVSCGLGPTDEDPVPGVDARGVRQVYIKPLRSSTPAPHPTSNPTVNENKEGEEERVCEHSFHPACLVSAERVAGWNGADQKKDLEREGEEREVQVSCPVCRAVGVISREDWDEGACALA